MALPPYPGGKKLCFPRLFVAFAPLLQCSKMLLPVLFLLWLAHCGQAGSPGKVRSVPPFAEQAALPPAFGAIGLGNLLEQPALLLPKGATL